jgi:hypothetical protein
MPNCSSCHAEILWKKTDRGKSIPLDKEPVEDGNIRINGAHADVLSALELTAAREDGELLHKSHFATCPNARKHRKKE